MSDIVLTRKGERLVQLCEASGFRTIEDLLRGSLRDAVCPAICMECGATAELEKDQRHGYCEKCGKRRMVSGLVLASFIL